MAKKSEALEQVSGDVYLGNVDSGEGIGARK